MAKESEKPADKRTVILERYLADLMDLPGAFYRENYVPKWDWERIAGKVPGATRVKVLL